MGARRPRGRPRIVSDVSLTLSVRIGAQLYDELYREASGRRETTAAYVRRIIERRHFRTQKLDSPVV